MTGHVLDAELSEVQSRDITWLRDRFWPTAKTNRKAGQTTSANHDDVVERARKYVEKMPPAISGKGGHNQTFRVACVLMIEFGLDKSDAMQILREYNRRCEPPWSAEELQHKIDSAAEHPGERGGLRDAPKQTRKKKSKQYAPISRIFPYHGPDGELRYEGILRVDGTYSYRRPDANAKSKWVWKIEPNTPYRLPWLTRTPLNRPVFVCRNELECHTLNLAAITGTCCPNGFNWNPTLNQYFAGRRVVVLGGDSQRRRIATQLQDVAAEVKLLVSDKPTKHNGKDILQAAFEAPAFTPSDEDKQLAAEAEKAARDPLLLDRRITQDIGLLVIGETPTREILVFSDRLGKTDRISSASRLTFPDLLQIAGHVAREKVLESTPDGPVPSMYTMPQVRNAIAVQASQRRISPDLACGLGYHIGNSGKGVLVGSGRAFQYDYDSRRLELVSQPFVDGKLLDFSCMESFDFDSLNSRLQNMSRDRAKKTVLGLDSVFSEWTWRQQSAHTMLAGLVLATMIQSTWKWRPQVALIGESSSGKSTLMETMTSIFGPLALYSSKPSEAGLRQTVKNRSVAILIDELEATRERRKIYELLRTASRGAHILRGTADQSGQSFGLRHICFVASIESGLVRQPDRNRFVRLEMLPIKYRMTIPLEDELRELGQEALAIAIYYAREAVQISERLKRHQVDGIESRVIESYSVPVAMLAVSGAYGDTPPEEILDDVLAKTITADSPAEADQVTLLRDILSIKVLVEKDLITAGEILDRGETFASGKAALERDGLKKAGKCLFVAPKPVQAKLKGTDWEGQSVAEILSRLPGAQSGVRRRCADVRHYGVLIPWEVVAEFLGDPDEDEDDETVEF